MLFAGYIAIRVLSQPALSEDPPDGQAHGAYVLRLREIAGFGATSANRSFKVILPGLGCSRAGKKNAPR